jgi:hypothetical protein
VTYPQVLGVLLLAAVFVAGVAAWASGEHLSDLLGLTDLAYPPRDDLQEDPEWADPA